MGVGIYGGLSKEQARINDKSRREARKWFGIYGNKNLVLHHKDESMKHNNIDRYILWLPDDLVVVSNSEHSRFHKSGERNHNYGKPMSEEAKQKSREKHLGEKNGMYGKPSPMKGKHRSEESNQKQREKMLGRPSPRKGTHCSEETKQKIREKMLGRPSPMKGKHRSEESIQKQKETRRQNKLKK